MSCEEIVRLRDVFSGALDNPMGKLQATLEFSCESPEVIDAIEASVSAYLSDMTDGSGLLLKARIHEPSVYERYSKDYIKDFLYCASIYFEAEGSFDSDTFCRQVRGFLEGFEGAADITVDNVAAQNYAAEWLRAYDDSRPSGKLADAVLMSYDEIFEPEPDAM